MRAILKNADWNEQLVAKGYVVIPGAVGYDLIEQVKNFYEQLAINVSNGFVLSNLMSDLPMRRKIHEFLNSELNPTVSGVMNDFKYVLGTFAVKPPGRESSFVLHQDWSLVDERKYTSLSAWIPLVDVSELNGCFRLLEGSKSSFDFPRGMNIPFPYENYASEITKEFMTPLQMKRGDMLIFDHRLVHDSGPNLSKDVRLAAVLALIPNEAELCHYYRKKETGEIDFYRLPEGFLVANDFFAYDSPPSGTMIEKMDYKDPQIDFEKFKQLYETGVSRSIA